MKGLLVVAVSYYAVSLVGCLSYPLAEPWGLSKATLSAVITLPVVAHIWVEVRRVRQHILVA